MPFPFAPIPPFHSPFRPCTVAWCFRVVCRACFTGLCHVFVSPRTTMALLMLKYCIVLPMRHCRLVGWLVHCLVGWLVGWCVGWLVGWLVVGLVGCLVGWLFGLFVCLFVCLLLSCWLLGLLVFWLAWFWVVWLFGWLVGSFVGRCVGLLVQLVNGVSLVSEMIRGIM